MMKRMLMAVAVLGLAMLTYADAGTVTISQFREIISPEVGAKICGYDADREHPRGRQVPQGQGRQTDTEVGGERHGAREARTP